MKRVILESPYGNADPAVVEQNVTYARACIRDALQRGEAPIASHLLYTQPGVLNDNEPNEREWGIAAGLAWGSAAEMTVVYVDRGISSGMRYGIERALSEFRQVEFRSLNPSLDQLVKKVKSWDYAEAFGPVKASASEPATAA